MQDTESPCECAEPVLPKEVGETEAPSSDWGAGAPENLHSVIKARQGLGEMAPQYSSSHTSFEDLRSAPRIHMKRPDIAAHSDDPREAHRLACSVSAKPVRQGLRLKTTMDDA